MKLINYIGHEEQTGYGISARKLIQALKSAHADVRTTVLGYGNAAEGGIVRSEQLLGEYDGVFIHTVPEYYPHWLRTRKAADPAKPVWGYTTWETDRLPPHWPDLLNRMDGLFVPSRWNKTVFEQSGVDVPVRVLPHISEFHGLAPASPPSAELAAALHQAAGKFVFYCIGMWNERKGIDLLLQAYLEQFTADDPVCLIIKTDEHDWTTYPASRWQRLFKRARLTPASDSLAAHLRRYNRPASVIHLTGKLPDSDIAWLHRSGDCFVSLTRGEGWGMGAYEACRFGNPVVMTGYGGQLDYLPADAAILVPYTLVPVRTAYGRESYRPEQRWAEPDIRAAGEALKNLAANPEAAKRRGRQLQQFVMDRFTPERIAADCLEVF